MDSPSLSGFNVGMSIYPFIHTSTHEAVPHIGGGTRVHHMEY